MKRRYLSILLVMTMIFFVTGGFAVPAKGALLPYTATLTITPSQSEIDVTTGSVDVIYTLKVTPPAGQHIGVFSFDLKAPAGMTLATNFVPTKSGDGIWLNRTELAYDMFDRPDAIFQTFSYTPVPNGYFIGSGTTSERNMITEADIMTIKATITDASKAGSYALAAENPNVGPDGTDTFTFAIYSTPAVVKDGSAVTPVDPLVDAAVTATEVTVGQTLACSTLSGTFKDPATSASVAGNLTWTNETAIVSATGDFGWTFTPTDTDAYNVITGTVEVVANPAAVPVTGVTLNKGTLSLVAGAEETLTAIVAPAEATNQNVTWSSNNEAVATVGTDGKVTAVAAGLATITVTTADGSFTDTCAVTVQAETVAVTGVTLDQDTMTLTAGGATGTLTATVAPENATNKNVSWTSSDESVATVANGVVTPVAAGLATITVTTADGNFTDTCAVTVQAATVAVTGVTLDQDTMTLTAGGATGNLTATVAPANATNKNVTWTSSDESVATVGNGVVTPVAAGTATITVTTADGSFTDTCEVTVQAATVAVIGVTLDQETMTLTAGGATGTLLATVAPENATNKNVSWISSDESVATVADGVVTPVAAGLATITVTTADGSFTDTCEVTVQAETVAVTGVTLDQDTMTLTAGGATGTLTATVAPEDATNKNVSWTSSDESVATVANGVVTPVAAGTATITVTTADGSFTDTCEVTVQAATVAVTGVTLDQDTMTLTAGGATGTLTATVAPENATNKNVSWTSSDESVATVANGVVTPVAAGLATITVTTADGNKTATCDVTVTTAGTYTVTLSGGGTGATGSGSYTAGETVNIAAGDRSGYTFKGWTSDDVTITNDSNKNTSFTMPAKNVTVTATWKKTNSGGGGGGAVAPTVAGVEIKSAPDKVTYTEGDALDLTGLELSLIYSNGNKKYASLDEIDENDITVSPKDGDVLDVANTEIVITVNGKSVKQAITVKKKETVTPPIVEEPVLNDIDEHWALDSIDYLVGIGAITGYPDETFRPDALITRAEFAKVIVDAFELAAESGKIFTDTADHWAKDYVAIAAAHGIVLGYNEDEFGPDDLITREQMAIIIVKAAGLTAKAGELDFIDKADISSWAYDWVVSAAENELMGGYEDKSFKPLNNATRAEAATAIYNVLMKQ